MFSLCHLTTKLPHRYLIIIVSLILSFNPTAGYAQPGIFSGLEPEFGCGTGVTDFNDGLGEWSVVDHAGGGEVWTRIGSCEEPNPGATNKTGGTGDAACTAPGKDGEIVRGIEFETSLVSPEFNLSGVTAATLSFKLVARLTTGDRLDVEISYDGGATWVGTPIKSWRRSPDLPSNTTVLPDAAEHVIAAEIDLAPYLGSSETVIRFRHYDPEAGDFGYYVQIDDVEITCTGGTDLEVTSSVEPEIPVEGQLATLTYNITNHGPETATNVRFYPFTTADKVVFEADDFVLPEGLDSTVLFGGVIPEIAAGETLTFKFTGTHLVNRDYLVDIDGSTNDPFVKLRESSPPPSDALLNSALEIVQINDDTDDAMDGCEPFTNATDIAGKIALSILDLRCRASDVAENAANAGAAAVIIVDDSPILIGLADAPTSDPIPVFSVKRDEPTADIKTAATSGGTVTISREYFTEGQVEALTAAIGEEVDSDYDNNFDEQTYTVLVDSDLDGAADTQESCDFDPAKTQPQFCGCGNVDSDLDATGIVDCLITDELALVVEELGNAVKKIKKVKLSGRKKLDRRRRKRLRKAKKLVRELLEALETSVSTSASELSVNSTIELDVHNKRIKRTAKKALKTNSGKFAKNKRRARKAIQKFRDSLVTTSL